MGSQGVSWLGIPVGYYVQVMSGIKHYALSGYRPDEWTTEFLARSMRILFPDEHWRDITPSRDQTSAFSMSQLATQLTDIARMMRWAVRLRTAAILLVSFVFNCAVDSIQSIVE